MIGALRICEILFRNKDPAEDVTSDSQLCILWANDDLANLANAFTRRGFVKHLWSLNGLQGQPSGPAPPNPEPELIPSGTLEPPTASWEADPNETEPPAGQHRLVPFGDPEEH
jgi:hypothetical protein